MNCGYDPDPFGHYETPPIAPQMWQSYQIAGEMTAMSILGALDYRLSTGRGQHLSTSVHEAVSKSTELDMPNWVFLRLPHHRHTCRHSTPETSPVAAIAMTKDGRWIFPYKTYAGGGSASRQRWKANLQLLKQFGMEADLEDPKYATEYQDSREAFDHMATLTNKLIGAVMYDRDLWRQAQKLGLTWAPIRHPEENVADEHWLMREAFFEVVHDELGETLMYTGGKWFTEDVPRHAIRRPPLVGEHTDEVFLEWTESINQRAQKQSSGKPPVLSRRDKPFALSDIRVIDLSWMLASAGAGRFLAAMGAEVIKVEHESHHDGMRAGVIVPPAGGRAERDRATGPISVEKSGNPNSNLTSSYRRRPGIGTGSPSWTSSNAGGSRRACAKQPKTVTNRIRSSSISSGWWSSTKPRSDGGPSENTR